MTRMPWWAWVAFVAVYVAGWVAVIVRGHRDHLRRLKQIYEDHEERLREIDRSYHERMREIRDAFDIRVKRDERPS